MSTTTQTTQGPQRTRDGASTRWTRMSRDQRLFTELLWSGAVSARATSGLCRATVTLLASASVSASTPARAAVRMGHSWRICKLSLSPVEVGRLRRLACCPEAWSAVVEDVDLWESWRNLGEAIRMPPSADARELEPAVAARMVLAEALARFAALRPQAPEAIARAASGQVPAAARHAAAVVGPASAWPEGLESLRDGAAEVLAIARQLDRGMTTVETHERLYDLEEGLDGLAARIDMLDACIEEADSVEFGLRVAVRGALAEQAVRVDARRGRVATVRELVRSGYVSVCTAGSMLVGDRDAAPLERVTRCETVLSWCVEEVRLRVQAASGTQEDYAPLVAAMSCWMVRRAELLEAYAAASLPSNLWRVSTDELGPLRGLDIDRTVVMRVMQRAVYKADA